MLRKDSAEIIETLVDQMNGEELAYTYVCALRKRSMDNRAVVESYGPKAVELFDALSANMRKESAVSASLINKIHGIGQKAGRSAKAAAKTFTDSSMPKWVESALDNKALFNKSLDIRRANEGAYKFVKSQLGETKGLLNRTQGVLDATNRRLAATQGRAANLRNALASSQRMTRNVAAAGLAGAGAAGLGGYYAGGGFEQEPVSGMDRLRAMLGVA